MLLTAIVCFSLAALLGIILISYVLRNKPTPKGLAFIHGPIALVGIILLLFYAFYHSPTPIESILLFIIAALGGLILILRDLTGKSIPKWLAIIHGMIAVIAFVFLLVFTVIHSNFKF